MMTPQPLNSKNAQFQHTFLHLKDETEILCDTKHCYMLSNMAIDNRKKFVLIEYRSIKQINILYHIDFSVVIPIYK